jgi:hypothetical protein
MVVVLSADPSLLTSQCLAQREHLVEQLSGDALPLEGWRNADLVDLEFSRLVRVSVDHRRALSHHLVACQRDNHEMARFRQIGGGRLALTGLSKTSTATRWRLQHRQGCRLILISMKLPPRSFVTEEVSQGLILGPLLEFKLDITTIRLNGGAHDRWRKTHAANSPNARRRIKGWHR